MIDAARVLAVAAVVVVFSAPSTGSADPVCKEGGEVIDGKCSAKCEVCFVRAPGGIQFVVDAPTTKKF